MKFDLTGYDIENLLKKLYLKKITLYNVVRLEHNHVRFEVDDKDEKKVKRYIKNFKVISTLGFVKRLPKLTLANLGIILGVFFGMIFAIFASNYTWQIEVYGTKDLTESDITNVLNDNGIRVGKINLQSSEEIENILLNNYDMIAQVSVIRQGTSIIINISEKLVYVEQTYQPIVAKFNGIVTDINIITGTTNVKVGDYVNVGDPLVLPFNINSNGEKVSVEPMAEIRGQIFVVSKCELNRYEYALKRTGNSITVYNYKIFGYNLFSGKAKNSFALFEADMYNEYISDLLPISRDVITYYEVQSIVVEHNFEAEKDDLARKSVENAYSMLPQHTEMLDENTETTIVGDKMFACTTITVLGVING